jgi:hypothetical protein
MSILASLIARAVADCLSVTTSLGSLEFEDISLQPVDIATLAKGLGNNKTVKHLALKYCRIGDSNVEGMCFYEVILTCRAR